MSDADQDGAVRDGGRPSGNLSPVALGLGVAGLLMGLVPFYGFFFALPLSVVAIVLGLTARGRPEENRRQATGGLITGAIGLLAVVGWAGWFAWGQLGFGTFTSQTSVEVGAGQAVAPRATVRARPPTPHVQPSPDAGGPATVRPGDLGGDKLVTGLSGRAEITIAGHHVMLELTDCALAEQTDSGVLLRGEGPDGRLAVARPDAFAGLVLDIETDDGPHGTYLGTVTGMSSRGSGGGLIQERRRFAIEGQLSDAHSGQIVEVDITTTCS